MTLFRIVFALRLINDIDVEFPFPCLFFDLVLGFGENIKKIVYIVFPEDTMLCKSANVRNFHFFGVIGRGKLALMCLFCIIPDLLFKIK